MADRIVSLARQFWSLSKPRIVALLTLTGLSGLLAAGGASGATTLGFTVAGACVAAGSAAFNCYYDRRLDARMERTADRPLPDGQLDHRTAAAFVTALLGTGTVVGLVSLPVDAVAYMWLGVVSYAGVYTVGLKRRHWLGVVLGGSAGAFPVLAGWSVVAPMRTVPLLFAGLVFVWTPAHAWALGYVYRDDFVAAGVPTLPAVASAVTVRRAVWLSAVLTAGVAVVTVPVAGAAYAVACLVGVPAFLWAYWGFYRDGSEPHAVRAFFTSNLLVATLFAAWAVDGVLGPLHGTALLVEAVAVLAAFLGLWLGRPSLGGVESRRVAVRRPLAAGVASLRGAGRNVWGAIRYE
ncbi:MAG: protoheme IX farnesyltransferase [Haloplanus sp.]